MPPGTAAGHDEHHRGEHGTIIHRGGTTTLRTRAELRNQGLGQRPQLIRHQVLGQRVDHEPSMTDGQSHPRETRSK